MRIVAWDTETGGLDWWNPKHRAFLATWADESGEYCADLSDPAQAAQFTEALKAADLIVAHNLAFDTHMVRETLGLDVLDLTAELHDTDLLSRVLHPEGQRKGERGGHSLKNLAKVYLRADAADSEDAIKEMAKQIGLRTIKQTGAYYDVWRSFPSVMETYAKNDARFTFDLYQKFARDVEDVKRVYELERAVTPILIRAEQRGIRTDQAAVQRLKAEYEPRLAEVHKYLTDELGEQALGGEGSSDALTEALLGIGVPLHRKTASGKLATNKFALNEFAKEFPQIEALEEFRTLTRFMNTYIAAVEGNEIVHTSIQQCEAWTGRMSSRRPNLQNLPKRAGKEVRSVFIPREGHSFVVCDYESIEIRLLAWYLGDAGFRQLIEDGLDPHAWMATNIWGGELSDYVKGGPQDALRSLSKNILFAITYGAGAPRVMDMLVDADFPASREDAKRTISAIKASLPGYYRLQKRIRDKIENVGHVNTLFGRKNPVARDKAYVGLNAVIQGSAADVMKQGLVNADQVVRPLGATPLLVVHDEIVIESPTENAEEVLRLTEQALIQAYDLSPRLAVSGSVVHTNYADA